MLRVCRRLLLVACLGLCLPAAAVASTTIDVRGTYSPTGQPGPMYSTTEVVDAENCGAGTFSGHGYGGSYTWKLAGTIDADKISYRVTYDQVSYTADFAGTVTADASRETGTFHDSNGSSGPFDDTRRQPGPDDGGCGKRASATAVACDTENPGTPSEDFRCTATVGDASSQMPPLTPTGDVTFALDPGAGGSFAFGPRCTLAPSASGPTAFCAVTYQPGSQAVPTGSQPPLSATYAGARRSPRARAGRRAGTPRRRRTRHRPRRPRPPRPALRASQPPPRTGRASASSEAP